MNAEIITIGNELLIGDTLDTNSTWISQRLNEIGVHILQKTSIADTPEAIVNALDQGKSRSDVILITGGLGPTKDDLTKNTLIDYFNDQLVLNEEVFERLKQMFEKRGRSIDEHNKKQAMLPSKCKVIPNHHGTASGMWFEEDDTIFVSMPGVPNEMRGIMKQVLKDLSEDYRVKKQEIIHKYVLTAGIWESKLMELIGGWEEALPKPFQLAYLPSKGMVKLRLSAVRNGEGKSREAMEKEMDVEIDKLKPLIPNYIVAFTEKPLEAIIGDLLRTHNITMATAESCTGGYIAHLITSIPGSSDYFRGSVVSYHNDVKQEVLGVKGEDLMKHGAVSKEVVEQMALGALKMNKVDYAVATSGVAGPDGGSEEKPVGTVWIAVASVKGVMTKKMVFGIDRMRNIERASYAALNILRKEILNVLVS